MEKRASGSTNQNEARISINRESAPKETRRKIGRTFTYFKRQDRSAVIPVSETLSLDLSKIRDLATSVTPRRVDLTPA